MRSIGSLWRRLSSSIVALLLSPLFAWYVISLMFCLLFIIQIQKFTSMTLLSISFLN